MVPISNKEVVVLEPGLGSQTSKWETKFIGTIIRYEPEDMGTV